MNRLNEYLYQKNILRREEIEVPVSIERLNEILSTKTEQKAFDIHREELDRYYFISNISWAVLTGGVTYFLRKHNEIVVFAYLTPIDMDTTRVLLYTKLRLAIYFITALFGFCALVVLVSGKEKLLPLLAIVLMYPIFIGVFGFLINWQEKYLLMKVKKFLRSL